MLGIVTRAVDRAWSSTAAPHRAARRLAVVTGLAVAVSLSPAVEVVAYARVPEVVASEVTLPAGTGLHTAAADGPHRSVRFVAGQRFSSVGFRLPPRATIAVRSALGDGDWTPWTPVPVVDPDEGPDVGSDEGGNSRSAFTDPVFVHDADRLQISVTGARVDQVVATLIDAAGLNGAGKVRIRLANTAADASTRPSIVTRSQWGADESWVREAADVASGGAHVGIVHHTAGANDYAPGDVPAILRAIYHYHVFSRGWDDIGYNFLVDRYGRVFEGRAGGMTRAVIGAHARNYNTGSIGVSVLGNFADAATAVPSAALNAVADVFRWKFGIHHIDPYGTYRFPDGRTVPTVIGHRDVGTTSCPGHIHDDLGQLRGAIADGLVFEDVPSEVFRDVSSGGVHTEAILRLYQARIVLGCDPSHFCPGEPLNRGQAASLIVRALPPAATADAGDPDPAQDPPPVGFTDVDPQSVHGAAITALSTAGVLTGFDDGTFRPTEVLTRAQLASVLGRALGVPGGRGTAFDDVEPGSTHGGAIYALKIRDVIGGCAPAMFCPTQPISRAQMASLLDRSLAWLAAQEVAEEEPADGATDPEQGDDGGAPAEDPADPGSLAGG